MKKLFTYICAALLLVGCSTPIANPDGVKFKEEYEALNGTLIEGSDTNFMDMEIAKENPVVYATIDDVLEVVEGTGIILFGFPECPWCRNAIPTFIDVANELKVETIYYYNIKDERDVLELVDGEIVEKTPKGANYQLLYDAMYEDLSVYGGLEDDSIKRLYFPTVYIYKDGELVLKQESTVESHTDSQVEMNEAQKTELKEIYANGIKKMQSSVCDIEQAC